MLQEGKGQVRDRLASEVFLHRAQHQPGPRCGAWARLESGHLTPAFPLSAQLSPCEYGGPVCLLTHS